MVDTITMKRLVIMKQIFSHGEEHRQKHTQISNMLACHHYDLSVEMLLNIIGTELGTTLTKNMDFWQLWNEININFKNKFNTDLPLRHEIKPLRNARNSIQHSGTIPSDSDVERFEGYARTFINDTVNKVFLIDYENIKLSELINKVTLKTYLDEAENLIGQNDFVGAIEKISIVFEIGKRKAIETIYENEWSEILPSYPFTEIDIALGSSAKNELVIAFKNVESMLNMLALTLDYREYITFKKKSIRIYYYPGLKEPKVIKDGIEVRTKEDADFCYNFVLNSFIAWGL